MQITSHDSELRNLQLHDKTDSISCQSERNGTFKTEDILRQKKIYYRIIKIITYIL